MTVSSRARHLIEHHQLAPHPEGGYYRETFRSSRTVAAHGGERNALTLIYFLLPEGSFSAFHRVRSDEAWHFYEGSPLELHSIDLQGHHHVTVLDGSTRQWVVPAGHWQAARPQGGYAFVGCSVAPGFSFEDFEMADPKELVALFPQHGSVLETLVRQGSQPL